MLGGNCCALFMSVEHTQDTHPISPKGSEKYFARRLGQWLAFLVQHPPPNDKIGTPVMALSVCGVLGGRGVQSKTREQRRAN